jgi:hypothetical protein
MLFFASRESRDVKRVSDIGVLRSSMAAVKVQYGNFQESGCQAGAVSACVGWHLNEILPTIKNFKDPSGKVLCAGNCKAPCEYSFVEAPTANNYAVRFFLEKGVGNYSTPGCYELTAGGVNLVK